jgi:iron complex transport system ATP-binding protein
MILQAEHLTFGYQAEQSNVCDVTLSVEPGIVTALFGPNGSGKSTLLRCMNGSLSPQSGQVQLNGHSVHAMAPRQVARHIAVVPQEVPANVPFTAAEMVMLGRYSHWDFWGQESPEDRDVILSCLERMGAADLASKPFDQLSGGDRQRVLIARALAQQGQVLLLDEPASHLDISHQLQLYHLVRELACEGQAILMICHDILVAPMFVDHAVLLASGRIVSAGEPANVLCEGHLQAVFGCPATITWQDRAAIHAVFRP